MESAVERYKRLLAEALARYFPRTTEYLRAEREAAQPQPRGRGKTKGNAKAPAKRTAIWTTWPVVSTPSFCLTLVLILATVL